MEFSFQILLCSYVNWCSSCSNVKIETAVNVTTVDWSGCTDTRQYNMTVTNSDYVVLYRNSTTCCSGNLKILYNAESEDKSSKITRKSHLAEHLTSAEIHPSRDPPNIRDLSYAPKKYAIMVLDHYENTENVAEAFEMTETDGSRVLPTTNNYMDLQRTVEFSSLTISVQ
uniref:Uncharacterized protein n=1 Tax=Magallana gigas TaxID=29159 RepID=A0A8W8MUM1_MAGGI